MNHYDILEVSPHASQEVIRAAYKSLMQRYHPDKNPGHPEYAQHAARLAQAYGVLSEAGSRQAYDLQRKAQVNEHVASPARARPSAPARSAGRAPAPAPMARKDRSARYAWLLIAVILLSGGLMLALSPSRQPLPFLGLAWRVKPVQPAGQQAPADPRGPSRLSATAQLAGEESQADPDMASKTLTLLASPLTVRLKAPDQLPDEAENPLAKPDHILSIPRVIVSIGSSGSASFLGYIERRSENIGLELTEKLADARYEKLIQADGEHYLKTRLLAALQEIIGTERLRDAPLTGQGSAAPYGITDVFLPESFSLTIAKPHAAAAD